MNHLPPEISHQKLPSETVGELEYREFAPSLPLHQLEGQAPPLADRPFQHRLVGFHYANDESAVYWQQLAARVGSAEYQAATNRTALLVGESSLVSALPYIMENTVILVDANPQACMYMQRYVDALRTEPDIESWHRRMAGHFNPDHNGDTDSVYRDRIRDIKLRRQIKQWQDAGLAHGLDDEEAYQLSSRLARQKAIIPWRVHLQDRPEVRSLAQVLRGHRATITLANLTNVVDYLKPGSEPLALDELPATEHVPIMASSMMAITRTIREILQALNAQEQGQDSQEPAAKDSQTPFGPTYLVGATGPFFGVGNFAEQGGVHPVSTNERSFYAAYRRRYQAPKESDQQKPADRLSM
jgi:hypothetical protein